MTRIFVTFEDAAAGFLCTQTSADEEATEEVMQVKDFEIKRRADDHYVVLPALREMLEAYKKLLPDVVDSAPQVITPEIVLNAPRAKKAVSKIERDKNTGAIKAMITEYTYE